MANILLDVETVEGYKQRIAELEKQVEEQRGYAKSARGERHKYGAQADRFEGELGDAKRQIITLKKELAVMTDAAEVSGKLAMQAGNELVELIKASNATRPDN